MMYKLIIALIIFMNIIISGQTIMRIWKNGAIVDTTIITDDLKITFGSINDQFDCGTSTVSYNGQIYNTVLIGNQCWLKENINVGIKIVGSSDQSDNNIIEKYCYNNEETNCTVYGGLYQWAETVQYQNGATNASILPVAFTGYVRGICPIGWHIPTRSEFEELRDEVNGDGNTLKAIGQGTGSGAGTNTSGYSALFAGDLSSFGFNNLGVNTDFWSTTENSAEFACDFILVSSSNFITTGNTQKNHGYSVRCIKD